MKLLFYIAKILYKKRKNVLFLFFIKKKTKCVEKPLKYVFQTQNKLKKKLVLLHWSTEYI